MAWISLPGCQSGEFQPESDHVDRCHELCYNKSDGQLSSHVSSCDVRTREGPTTADLNQERYCPLYFYPSFFAVDLLPPPRMEIHFIKLDAKFDIFSFVMWRVTLIVRFLRNFNLINDKSDVQHKFRTYQSINIYLFQVYPLKHFSKRNIRKIPKIDYIKKKLFLLKDISKNRRNYQDGISWISRSRIIISKISKDRSTIAIIGCETVAKAGFQEVGRREQRNGKSDDNGVATSAFNALTVSLQAPPGGVRTVPDALFSKVSVAALQARGNGYGAKGELQDATSRHPE